MSEKKMYYTMGEVSEMLDVSPSLIRFWEKRFKTISPAKNKRGNRLFTAADLHTLKTIYHLVKERGMTLAGAERQLKSRGVAVDRDMELAERLGAIRALLVEVRNELGGGGVIVDDDPAALDEVAPADVSVAAAAASPAAVATAEVATAEVATAEVATATASSVRVVPMEVSPAADGAERALFDEVAFEPGAVAEGAACPEAGYEIVSTASAGAFSASEQEFAYVNDDDDDPEYDSNPEFDHEPDTAGEQEFEQAFDREPAHEISEPEFAWDTEPEPRPEHRWEPEDESEPESEEVSEPDDSERSPHPDELTLF